MPFSPTGLSEQMTRIKYWDRKNQFAKEIDIQKIKRRSATVIPEGRQEAWNLFDSMEK